MRDADVGAKVTPDRYVVARGERALGSLVPHRQHGWGWSAHHDQLYRQPRGSGPRISTGPAPPGAAPVFDGWLAGDPPFTPESGDGFPDDVSIADGVAPRLATTDAPPGGDPESGPPRQQARPDGP
ncbi:hypothetical protein A9X03_25200 [Mycobacterium sp. E1715]|nr:hypothetical protein A9X03_25200 [Mycobacterium sp. E1715]